jgi:hypothetical protein
MSSQVHKQKKTVHKIKTYVVYDRVNKYLNKEVTHYINVSFFFQAQQPRQPN